MILCGIHDDYLPIQVFGTYGRPGAGFRWKRCIHIHFRRRVPWCAVWRSIVKIDILGFQAFLSVSEQGSFQRAAAALNVSQAALSHRIAKFEKDLGVQLLSRTTVIYWSNARAGDR